MPEAAAIVHSTSPRRIWLGADALLFVIVLALFFVSSANGFAPLDDHIYVYKNALVQKGLSLEGAKWAWTTTDGSNWHPLTWYSLQLDATLFGPGPWGFHLTNVILHALAAASLSLALRSLTGDAAKSWGVALLFAVHPLRVESVAWISERKDVLSVLFGIWTLVAYSWYAQRRTFGRGFLVAVVFSLSLLSKPMLVTLPAVLLLLDFWPLRRTANESWQRLVAEKLPLLGLSAAITWITILAQQSEGAIRSVNHFPFLDRLANGVLAVAIYLRQTVWPLQLCAYYPHLHWDWLEPAVGLSAVMLIAISAIAFALRQRAPYLLVGWLWFLGTLFPVLGVLVQFGGQGHADRYTYWPHIGLFIGVVWGVAGVCQSLRWPRAVPVALLTLVTGIWSVLTHEQIGLWKSTGHVWTQAISVTERNALALFGLAAWEQQLGNPGQAFALYQLAWQADPQDGAPLAQLGALSLAAGDTRRALAYLEEARTLSPKNGDAWRHLGEAYRAVGRTAEARKCLELAIQLKPNDGSAYCSLGMLLLDPANPQVAVELIEKGVALNPDYAPFRFHLGTAYVWAGRDADAVAEFQKAITLEKEAVEAAEQLGLALERLGRAKEAVPILQQGLETFPPERCGFLRALIGFNLASSGRANEAGAYYAEAIRSADNWSRQVTQEAWRWLTAEKPAARRPQLGLQIARLLQQAMPKNPDGYDLAAAVEAVQGRFEPAQRLAEQALQFSEGDVVRSQQIRRRLELYRESRIWVGNPPDSNR